MSTDATAETKANNEAPSPSAIFNGKANITSPHFADKEVRFTFKTPRKKDGEADGADGVMPTPSKRPAVTLVLPTLTFEGFIEKLTEGDEKVKNWILETVNEQIILAAREQVNDEDNPVNSQGQLNLAKLTIEAIANTPKSDRVGGGISKETWEDFEKDYIITMVAATCLPQAKVEKAAKLFVMRLNPVKSEKQVLIFLRSQLALWAANTAEAESFAEVYTFLDSKIETLLNRDSSELLAALG